jgi:hypothetical protein
VVRRAILDLQPGRGITRGAKRVQLVGGSIDVQPYGPLAQVIYQNGDCIVQWVMTPAEVEALGRVLCNFVEGNHA